MEKKVFTWILVIAVGVLLGVAIVSKQAREPLLREMLTQQQELINSQKNIEQKLSDGVSSKKDANIASMLTRMQAMEGRIAKLESQVKNQPQAVPERPAAEDYSRVYDIPVAHTPIIGKKAAKVTITEFVDFQCPFCSRFHPPVAQILKEFPDDVNYVIKNFPLNFHPQARPASKAAFAAGQQGKYGEMVDALLLNNRDLSEQKFERIAGDLGLNVEKFKKDYKDRDAEWEKYIKEDMELAAKVGVRGTPTFFINGRKTLARDFESFKKEIVEILNK